MKILGIIVEKEGIGEKIYDLENVFEDFVRVVVDEKNDEATVLNKAIKEAKDDYTHIVILPQDFSLNENYLSLIKEYCKDEKTVYLPLVELQDLEGNFKGVINSSFWWANFCIEQGKLDDSTALKQVDTTLYSGLIPLSVAKKYKFKKDLRIYYHFEFLNKITSSKVAVVGVPKILSTISYDYTLEGISKEEKIELFEAARKEYSKSNI